MARPCRRRGGRALADVDLFGHRGGRPAGAEQEEDAAVDGRCCEQACPLRGPIATSLGVGWQAARAPPSGMGLERLLLAADVVLAAEARMRVGDLVVAASRARNPPRASASRKSRPRGQVGEEGGPDVLDEIVRSKAARIPPVECGGWITRRR